MGIILAGLGLVRIVKNSNLGLENAARGLGIDFDCKQYLTEYYVPCIRIYTDQRDHSYKDIHV